MNGSRSHLRLVTRRGGDEWSVTDVAEDEALEDARRGDVGPITCLADTHVRVATMLREDIQQHRLDALTIASPSTDSGVRRLEFCCARTATVIADLLFAAQTMLICAARYREMTLLEQQFVRLGRRDRSRIMTRRAVESLDALQDAAVDLRAARKTLLALPELDT